MSGLISLLLSCLVSFVYETEHFNGVAELLEILGRFVDHGGMNPAPPCPGFGRFWHRALAQAAGRIRSSLIIFSLSAERFHAFAMN